jgi:hypothetical protein
MLAAIRLAQQDSHFRYAIEQVLFAQHFWDNYPQYRADLKAAIQNRQITFAWAGVTQPETSLVAPAIQERNLQLGRQWIADMFGAAYVPHTAWQSDAFGTSAAFPGFLSKYDIPYLFIGRGPRRCDQNAPDCVSLPHAFYWKSPAVPDQRILVAYLSYPTAWDAVHKLPDETAQIDALRRVIDDQFSRANGNTFFCHWVRLIDPLPNLSALVAKWNAADQTTALVMADPKQRFSIWRRKSRRNSRSISIRSGRDSMPHGRTPRSLIKRARSIYRRRSIRGDDRCANLGGLVYRHDQRSLRQRRCGEFRSGVGQHATPAL